MARITAGGGVALPAGSSAGDVPVWSGSGWSTSGAIPGAAPGLNGMVAWNFPLESAGSVQAAVSGVKYVLRVPLPAPQTFTTVWLNVSTIGATLTAGQNLISVYNSSGAQIGSTSADQAGVWTATGTKSATVGSPGSQSTCVYVEILSVGTTPPTFRGFANTVFLNSNVSAANLRAATSGTGATAVDASITPGSLSTSSALPIWVGLS